MGRPDRGEVDALYHQGCGRTVELSTDENGVPFPFDRRRHSNLIVKGNRRNQPPGTILRPGEAIGIVIHPIRLAGWKYALCVVGGSLLGLGAGRALWRK